MEKKKSYLSKQAIAAIVIATVVVVALPIYFFLLKPMFEKEDTPETGPVVYEPLIGNEKHSGVNSQYERGGTIYIYSLPTPETQVFDVHAQTGDWSFTNSPEGLFIKDYESIVVSQTLFSVCSAMRAPIGVHIAPSRDLLLEMRAKKAAGMSREELEAVGGLNQLRLTADEIADIEIDFAEYGLSDLENADRYSFTDGDGVAHTVYLGDYTVNGAERYARVDGVNAVYKLAQTMTTLVSSTLYDAMPPVVTDVTGDARTGGYVPDKFSIMRNGAVYVDIERFTDSEAIEKDRLTTSLLVRSFEDQEGNTYYNYYDTSSEYSTMLYKYFRSGIYGTRVVAAPKSKMVPVGDIEAPVHGDFTEEELSSFGINIETPYRVLFTAKYLDDEPDESGDLPALVNYLIFSEPFTENGEEYYHVYNTGRGTVVLVKSSAVPFVEENEEFFAGRYVSVVAIDAIDTISLDTTALPEFMLGEGVERLKESFTLNYTLKDGKRVRDSKNRIEYSAVVLSDGTFAPAADDGTSATENFRNFYYHFGTVKLFTNVERYLDKIAGIDLENEGMSLTYSIYGKDRSHTMKFYFFDEAGIWAFYTVDGEGRYIARTEDIKTIVKGLMLVKTGGSVARVLGEPG